MYKDNHALCRGNHGLLVRSSSWMVWHVHRCMDSEGAEHAVVVNLDKSRAWLP